jgi:hypothetical protein
MRRATARLLRGFTGHAMKGYIIYFSNQYGGWHLFRYEYMNLVPPRLK